MNKVTLILISIIYVASIVVISIFGLKVVVYNEVIPVTEISCINETDSRANVWYNDDGKKVIEVIYTEPGNAETMTGTMLQLEWRVLPDNASTKEVKFIVNKSERVFFVKDGAGNDIGLLLFTGPVMLNIGIKATDGSSIYTEVIVWVHNPKP